MGILYLLFTDKGIKFHVNGFIHKGHVEIAYNDGKDLFEVTLTDSKDIVVNRFKEVYFDQIIATIDEAVERTNDYQKQVNEFYNF